MRRALWTCFICVIIGSCASPSDVLFPGRGPITNLRHHFRVGCPRGWEYSTTGAEAPDGVLLRRLTGRARDDFDVDGGLVQKGEFHSGESQPATASALFSRIADEIGLSRERQRSGQWHGRPAGWVQFGIPQSASELISIQRSWWAAILSNEGWVEFRFDVIMPAVTGTDFQEIVDGFEPLSSHLDLKPYSVQSPERFQPCP